jgi:hypothetical protein
MRADIDAHVAAVLQSRIKANASGQGGEDANHIRAELARRMGDEYLRAMRLAPSMKTPDLDEAVQAYLAAPFP